MLLFQFLILQIIVFGAVLFLLKKILSGDTESAVTRLNRVYQELLKKQEELTQKIQAAEKEYAQKKEESIQIKNKMMSEVVEESRQKKDEMMKAAKAEADELIEKARAATEKNYHEIEKEVGAKTIDYAADIIHLVFTQGMIDALHREMVNEFIAGGEKFDLTTVGSQLDQLIIRTALPLTEDEKNKISTLVLTKLKRPLKIEETVDKVLIAGMLLQFGTLILDGSIFNALKEASWQAKKKLKGEV
jgi:F-type H+-transporting ATPase subunit b